MEKPKIKLITTAIIFFLLIIAINVSVYATNENIEIIQKNSEDYLIYIKDNLKSDFEFAFSNDKNADKSTLNFKIAETDRQGENANKVAYVNDVTKDLFTQNTYMWAKDSEGNYFIDGVEIDLDKSIHEYDLEHAINITNIIPIDSTKTQTTVEEVDDKKITTTVGKAVLTDVAKNSTYSYFLVTPSNLEQYNEFLNLGNRISKFNSETDIYTEIKVYRNFLEIFNKLIPDENQEWKTVENNEILQPTDAEDGEQYVLWIREMKDGEVIKQDVQILTSHKEYKQEKIKEIITTSLPITYDNNVLLIVLGILIVATIIVYVKIKKLSKKQEK